MACSWFFKAFGDVGIISDAISHGDFNHVLYRCWILQFLLDNGKKRTFSYTVACKKFSWSGQRGGIVHRGPPPPLIRHCCYWYSTALLLSSITSEKLQQLHWLPVQHWTTKKLTVLMYKVPTILTPSVTTMHCAVSLATTIQQFSSTDFAKSAFRCTLNSQTKTATS